MTDHKEILNEISKVMNNQPASMMEGHTRENTQYSYPEDRLGWTVEALTRNDDGEEQSPPQAAPPAEEPIPGLFETTPAAAPLPPSRGAAVPLQWNADDPYCIRVLTPMLERLIMGAPPAQDLTAFVQRVLVAFMTGGELYHVVAWINGHGQMTGHLLLETVELQGQRYVMAQQQDFSALLPQEIPELLKMAEHVAAQVGASLLVPVHDQNALTQFRALGYASRAIYVGSTTSG